MSTDELTNLKQRIAQQINTASAQLEAIQQTHSRLVEFVFQTVTSAKSLETNEERLTLAVNGMQEIKKYADQEIQKYTHNLGNLTGKLEGIEIALVVLSSESDTATIPDEDISKTELNLSDDVNIDDE